MWFLVPAAVFVVVGAFRMATCPAGWRAWICYRIAWIHRLLFARCRTTNACPFPEQGPAIVVANHTSPVDPVLIWHRHFAQFRHPHLRVIGFMMAKEFYNTNAVIRWVCAAMESIPVERSGRDMAPTRAALKRLEEGRLLGIFPEGRLNLESPESRLLPGGTGVAWLAIKSRAPVIPVFIRNAPRRNSVLASYLARTVATVTYGEPIDISLWYDQKAGHEELAEITDLIMKSIADLGGIDFTPTGRDSGDRMEEKNGHADPDRNRQEERHDL